MTHALLDMLTDGGTCDYRNASSGGELTQFPDRRPREIFMTIVNVQDDGDGMHVGDLLDGPAVELEGIALVPELVDDRTKQIVKAPL